MRKSSLLNVLYENEKIVLSALNGNRTIYNSREVFPSRVDPDFKNWDLNKKSKSTPETEVKIYEMVKNATFKDIFTSLSDDLDSLCLTQDQIIDFCVKYPERLRQDGYGTFFLFKKRRLFRRDKFFVVRVRVSSDGLRVGVNHFDDASVWNADCRHRVVVPN
ncbi:MAG: hypothetical protein PHY55_08395 [Bacteroidales bacterium]|nr:hypothetical protein [Bacteroidales bacterium]